jgi:hypothetical protein
MNCELGDQWMIQGLPILNYLSAHQPFGGVSLFFESTKNVIFYFQCPYRPTVSVVDPYPDSMGSSGSGSRRAKMALKKIKQLK